jgi:predicted TIM-barrel fold metal-dependent hydrolase
MFDSLAHITPEGVWFDTSLAASIGDLQSSMRLGHVAKAIVSGLPDKRVNEYVLKVANSSGGQFLAVPILDPDLDPRPNEAVEQLKEAGATGVKIHPRLSRLKLSGEWAREVGVEASRHDLPLFICSSSNGIYAANVHDTAEYFRSLGKHFESLRVVLLHGGGVQVMQMADMIRPHKNVLLDLSHTITTYNKTSIGEDIGHLFRTFGNRICLGSDFPEFSFLEALEASEKLGLESHTPTGVRILGQNLEEFLRC